MTRLVHRTRTEGYGVAVEVRVEYADTATVQEIRRALQLAMNEALPTTEPTTEGTR